jgi:type IV conjugative transfer system pilin TraA
MELSNKAMVPFCAKKTKQQVVARWIMAFLLPLFALLSYTGVAQAVDLMADGAQTVTDTFGANSALAKWIILGEVIFGVITYIKTKNIMILFGIAIVIVFTTIGFSLAA